MVSEVKKHERGGVHGAVAGGDGVDVGGEVEEGGLDGEERGVCDMELGLVALDEEVVRSLERAKSLPILAFCGAFEGSNQNSPDDVDAIQGERSSQSRMIFER